MVEPTSWKWRERFYTSARMFFSPSTTLFRFSMSHTTFTLSILSSPLIIRTKNNNSPHSIFVLLGQFRWLPQIGMVPQPLSLSCSLSLPLSAVAFGSTHLVRSWIWFVFVFILLFLLVVFFFFNPIIHFIGLLIMGFGFMGLLIMGRLMDLLILGLRHILIYGEKIVLTKKKSSDFI